MAAIINPPKLLWFGVMSVYLSVGNAPPSNAGDGTFEVGDWVINGAPTAGGTSHWICTVRGAGNVATFKAVALGA